MATLLVPRPTLSSGKLSSLWTPYDAVSEHQNQAEDVGESINSGFRSIPLLNQFSEELELSALLVDVQMITLSDSSLVRSAHTVLQVCFNLRPQVWLFSPPLSNLSGLFFFSLLFWSFLIVLMRI